MRKEQFAEITKVANQLVGQVNISKNLKVNYKTKEAMALHEELIRLLTPIAENKAKRFVESSYYNFDETILKSVALFEGLAKALKYWDYIKFPNHFMNSYNKEVYNVFANYSNAEHTDKKQAKYFAKHYEVEDNTGKTVDFLDLVPASENIEIEVETNMLLEFVLKNISKNEKEIILALLNGKEPKELFEKYGAKERMQISRLKNKVVYLMK